MSNKIYSNIEVLSEAEIREINLLDFLKIGERRKCLPMLIVRLLMGTIKLDISSKELEIQNTKDYYTSFPLENTISDDHITTDTLEPMAATEVTEAVEEMAATEVTEATVEDVKIKISTFQNKLIDEVTEERISDYTDSLFRVGNRNYKIFDNIYDELVAYFYYQNNHSYTTAFLHLYRCYEYMAYMLPLAYLRNTEEYLNSYKDLKSFFGEDKDVGELKFFNNFIVKSLFNRDQVDSLVIDIEIAPEIFTQVKRDLQTVLGGIIDLGENIIHVKARNFHSFFITLRNRIFHFKEGTGLNNFNSNALLFDDLFKFLNEYIVNWIAYIYRYYVESIISN